MNKGNVVKLRERAFVTFSHSFTTFPTLISFITLHIKVTWQRLLSVFRGLR